MNFAPPDWIQKAANEAVATVSGSHYSHPRGRIRLRQALKKYYSPKFRRDLDLEKEILVTSGANEGQSHYFYADNFDIDIHSSGQYSVFVAFLKEGDEVIMFEPFFDQYLPSVTFNGGKPVYVPLHPDTSKGTISSDDWKIDFEELTYVLTLMHHKRELTTDFRRAITPRTKMIIVNTPHNPVGKVFTRTELEKIAALAEEHNLLVMADEVVCIPLCKHQSCTHPLFISMTL